MRACLRGLGICVVVLASLPLLAAQEAGKKKTDKTAKDDLAAEKAEKNAKKDKASKKKEGDEEPEKKEKKEKLVYGVRFQGKLKEMDANSQKEFTVEVQTTVPNPQGFQALAQAQANWQQRQINLFRQNNPRQRAIDAANLQRDIARDLPKLKAGCYKTQPYDVKLRAADKMRVRTLFLPIDYDDKGNVKKYTKKEKEALRGPDKSLPGYTSEMEALHAGQTVMVYLAKGQANPVPNSKKGAKGAAKLNPDDDAGDIGDQRPEVVMIVIMAEPKDR
jgi:hypothetical protein